MQAKDADLNKKDNDYAALREQMKPLTVCVCVCANRYIKVLYTETDRHTNRERARESKRDAHKC